MISDRKFNVYRFRTIDKTIVYVGYTGKGVDKRFEEHVKDKYWINKIVEVEACEVSNEAQARLDEMFYINDHKPIFNMKDKFAGAIQANLKTKDKKFNHCFYVCNGQITNCIPAFKEGYDLVIHYAIGNQHLGLYYDNEFNLHFSCKDICSILEITPSSFKALVKKHSDNFTKVTYDEVVNGTSKEQTTYVCNKETINLLIAIKNNDLDTRLSNALAYSSEADLSSNFSKKDGIIKCYNQAIEEAERKYSKSLETKKIVYYSVSNNISIHRSISAFINEDYMFDFKYEKELIASEIFALTEDLCNEHNISYKDVFNDFNIYMMKHCNQNFWALDKKVKSQHKDIKIQAHYVVAIYKDKLYNEFKDFYHDRLERVH